MPQPRVLPDDSDLIRLRDFEELSYAQIAARYGVTKSAVEHHFIRMGRAKTVSGYLDYGAFLPWAISREHAPKDAAVRLRAHIRAHKGLPLSDAMKTRLRNWYSRLRRERTVLDYRPADNQPWHYIPRQRRDDDLIIRWPEDHAPPTAEQRKALTLPTVG